MDTSLASAWSGSSPKGENEQFNNYIGFRIAPIPEPSERRE
jgi:hypothetical protein